jgi:hypothetical protein
LKYTGGLFQRNAKPAILGAMAGELTVGQKAAQTRKRSVAALKAARTLRRKIAFRKAGEAEAASKKALLRYGREHGWTVAFFGGPTGSPRTGIIDAILYRLGRKNADALDIRLIQLKGGNAGVSGPDFARLKNAKDSVTVKWLVAAFDGEVLHVLPDDPDV